MKYINIIFIIVGLLFLSIPAKSVEPTWINLCDPQVVSTNSQITCGDYTISHIQFSAPVKGYRNKDGKIVPEYPIVPGIIFNIKSSDNSTDKSNIVLLNGESWKDTNEKVKITPTEIPDGNSNVWIIENYNPTAKIYVQYRQLPKITLSLTSNKIQYEYGKDTNINITLSIKNDDTYKFPSMRIILSSNNLTQSSSIQKDFEYCCLDQTQSISYRYDYDVPNVENIITLPINFTIQMKDTIIPDKTDIYSISTQFAVIPENKEGHIYISKYITDRFYTSDNKTIRISIINQGKYSIYNVLVKDNNGGYLFPIDPNQKIEWNIPEIKPNEQSQISYRVYPTISGVLTIPETSVNYTYMGQNIQNISNKINIEIINDPSVKMRLAPVVPTQLPTPTITPKPQVVENIIPIQSIQPSPIETKVVPIIPPTATPNTTLTIPGFEGIYLISILFVIRKITN